jgi:hypothetical protein
MSFTSSVAPQHVYDHDPIVANDVAEGGVRTILASPQHCGQHTRRRHRCFDGSAASKHF